MKICNFPGVSFRPLLPTVLSVFLPKRRRSVERRSESLFECGRFAGVFVLGYVDFRSQRFRLRKRCSTFDVFKKNTFESVLKYVLNGLKLRKNTLFRFPSGGNVRTVRSSNHTTACVTFDASNVECSTDSIALDTGRK